MKNYTIENIQTILNVLANAASQLNSFMISDSETDLSDQDPVLDEAVLLCDLQKIISKIEESYIEIRSAYGNLLGN
jgi:hypothetical protein